MKVRRFGAAALALVFVLSASPAAFARTRGGHDSWLNENIVRLIQKIHRFFDVKILDDVDQSTPPLPAPKP